MLLVLMKEEKIGVIFDFLWSPVGKQYVTVTLNAA